MSFNPQYKAMREFWEGHWSDTQFTNEYATNFYPRRQEEFQTISKFLSREGPVLEAGCSFGHVADYFSKQGYRVIGLDYAQDALRIGRSHLPDMPLIQGDIHSLPFPDNSLGGYLSFGVLEHFEFGPIPALQEAYRVLRPGGIVAITMPLPTPLVREWIPGAKRWLRLEPLRSNTLLRRISGKSPRELKNAISTFYEQPYSKGKVRAFLESAGFHVLHQRPIYHSFWFYLVGKPFRVVSAYYKENAMAEQLGRVAKKTLPWSTAFFSLAIGQKE